MVGKKHNLHLPKIPSNAGSWCTDIRLDLRSGSGLGWPYLTVTSHAPPRNTQLLKRDEPRGRIMENRFNVFFMGLVWKTLHFGRCPSAFFFKTQTPSSTYGQHLGFFWSMVIAPSWDSMGFFAKNRRKIPIFLWGDEHPLWVNPCDLTMAHLGPKKM